MGLAELLNVDDALVQIMSQIDVLGSEKISLAASLGRILAEDIYADLSLPPYTSSSMDGYAVRAIDTEHAQRTNPVKLKVIMDIPAGSPPHGSIAIGQAARIMTGAVIPEGADAVVPVEDTDAPWGEGDKNILPPQVGIYRRVLPGECVRPIGEDLTKGDLVLKAGTMLRPQDLGMLAAIGKVLVPVVRSPRVAILSNGNELIDAAETLSPGKIRDVNSYTLAGLVQQYGGTPFRFPIAPDTEADIRHLFESALSAQPDLIISSAGVSVGAADLIRGILSELGEVNFWRINIRPGKPLAFGSLRGIPFFGLPGNPVSAMVTFDVMVRPVILKLGGRADDDWVMSEAMIKEDIKTDGRRTYLRVRLKYEDKQLIAVTTGTQSSGALMSMVLADGLLIVPEHMLFVPAGTILPVRLLRRPQPDLNFL